MHNTSSLSLQCREADLPVCKAYINRCQDLEKIVSEWQNPLKLDNYQEQGLGCFQSVFTIIFNIYYVFLNMHNGLVSCGVIKLYVYVFPICII